MGTIVKGVVSAFGGKKRRREQKQANATYQGALRNQDAFKMKNVMAGMAGPQVQTQGYDAALAQSGQLGPAAGAQLATLGPAQGYSAQGYESQGYDAGTTNVGGLLRGANTGLTNTMANLQVSTAAAEMQDRKTDRALAASQDLAAQAGTGGGGATALAAQAAESKSGITASIDQQVKQNERLRAQGESELQRSQLSQQNLASKFDLGQQQFNIGQENQAAQFGAQAANQAAQFGAQAQNQAARFGAEAENQFALSKFGAANQMAQFNASNQNQFAQSQFGADNQFALANQQAQNQAASMGASAANQAAMSNADYQFKADVMARQGEDQIQQFEFQKLTDQTGRAAAVKAQKDEARAQAKADLIGGIGGVLEAGASFLSDKRLKKNIKLIGVSKSGINIYTFKYKNEIFGKGVFQGVMADEVPSYAVVKDKSGFNKVDYSKIDVKFKSII